MVREIATDFPTEAVVTDMDTQGADFDRLSVVTPPNNEKVVVGIE
jgi:hypothetical protein